MNDREFKFVIVGTGNISNTYVNAIEKINGARVSGFVSRNLKKPSACKDFSSVEVSDSLSGIKNEFDAVILCTPNGLHHEGALEAASLGKHVLTEKPLDISIEAANSMITVCKEAGVKLGVAYQRRMSPGNIKMKKLIDSGKLGRIIAADLTVKNYRDDNYYKSGNYRGTLSIDGGGPFIQQASHYVDLYGWFFGRPVKVVSMLDTFMHDIEGEDHGAALLKHDNGMIGTIIASTSAKPGFPARLEIHAEKGTIIMENDMITGWYVDGVGDPTDKSDKNKFTGASTAKVEDTTLHEAVIKDFIESVQGGREPAVSGKEALLATEIILQIYSNNFNN